MTLFQQTEDSEIRGQILWGLGVANRSLAGLRQVAEEAQRGQDEYQKYLEEEKKAKELAFLQDLAAWNVDPQWLDSLRAEYHWQHSPWKHTVGPSWPGPGQGMGGLDPLTLPNTVIM